MKMLISEVNRRCPVSFSRRRGSPIHFYLGAASEFSHFMATATQNQCLYGQILFSHRDGSDKGPERLFNACLGRREKRMTIDSHKRPVIT
jgi:hypothetical protein